MLRRFTLIVLSASIILCLGVGVSYAVTLLSEKKAIDRAFGKGAKITRETRELKGKVLETVKKRLGGKLVHYRKGSKSKKVAENTTIEFIYQIKDGKKSAVALVDIEPGKWGPVKFFVALNLDGTVKRVDVMSYREKRGRPIARRSFLRQFEGKTGKDAFKIRRDITGISGATISSEAAAFAVKKAIILYEELCLNAKKTGSKK